MGKSTLDRIKKTVSVLLAVLFVVSMTASAGAACTDTASTSTGDTDKTLSTSDLGALIASILNNMGYNLDLGDSGSNSASGDYSDLSNLFNN